MHENHTPGKGDRSNYARLALMAILSFAAMYVLMYAMVDSLPNALPNLNQAYMAGLMAAPMVLIELGLMRAMYMNTTWNLAIVAISLVALIGFFAFIRIQAAIGDEQFVRSMIPHHGAAVLMCQQAPVRDPEIVSLCQRIIANQEAEIAEMQAILTRLGR